MRFLSSTCLIVLGFVSVACSAPLETVTARAPPSKAQMKYLTNLKSQLMLASDKTTPSGVIKKASLLLVTRLNSLEDINKDIDIDATEETERTAEIENFILNPDISTTVLGYTTSRSIVATGTFFWYWRKIKDFREKKLPAIVWFVGGQERSRCSLMTNKCVVIIDADPSSGSIHGMMFSYKVKDNPEYLGKVGNPAIITFLASHHAPNVANEPLSSGGNWLAHLKAWWVVVFTEAGFSPDPWLMFTNQAPEGFGEQIEVTFQVYGGMKCSEKPCFGSVKVDEHRFYGKLYEKDPQDEPNASLIAQCTFPKLINTSPAGPHMQT